VDYFKKVALALVAAGTVFAPNYSLADEDKKDKVEKKAVEPHWNTTRHIPLDDFKEGDVYFTNLIFFQDKSSTKLCGKIRGPDKSPLEFILSKDRLYNYPRAWTHRTGSDKYDLHSDIEGLVDFLHNRFMLTNSSPETPNARILKGIDSKKYDELVGKIVESEGYKPANYIVLNASSLIGGSLFGFDLLPKPNKSEKNADEEKFKQSYIRPNPNFRKAVSCERDFGEFSGEFILVEEEKGRKYQILLSSNVNHTKVYFTRLLNGNTYIHFQAHVQDKTTDEKKDETEEEKDKRRKWLQTDAVFDNKGKLIRVRGYDGLKREIPPLEDLYKFGIPYLERLIQVNSK